MMMVAAGFIGSAQSALAETDNEKGADVLLATPTPGAVNCYSATQPPLTTAQRGSVKFFPGHYVAVAGGPASKSLADAITETKSLPSVVGYQKRYVWADLETDKDQYNLTQIQKDLDAAQAAGKKLAIMILFKYKSSTGGNAMPSYLAKMGDGDYFYTLGAEGAGPANAGYLAKFKQAWVVDRFNHLSSALKRFDSHPALAAVLFNETALGLSLATEEADAHYAGLMKADRAAACFFRQTPVIQLTNFPKRLLASMTSDYMKYGIAFGGPDTFLNDPELAGAGQVYTFYPIVEAKIPIGVLVAGSNYRYYNHQDFLQDHPHNLSADDSVRQLAAFAKDKLKANYIFWKRDASTDPYYVAFLNRAKNRTLPALDRNCPSNFVCL
jgi:hypothetical protein